MTKKKRHSLVLTITIIAAIALCFLLYFISDGGTHKMVLHIGIPIVITLAVSIFYTFHRIDKLSNVDREEEAINYCEEEKYNLTLERDVFLRSVTTSEKIRDN